ncbi:hypothetical protein V3331_15730 [Gaopeijia maritima]|uniref:hypothetical protein n=1 Tax=Gaopeijia maritima TaxID=3119007 RepID=UPI003249E5B8
MNRSILTLLRAAYMLVVAGVLTFGFAQMSSAAVDWPECDTPGSGEIGSCPPYTQGSCDDRCVELYGTLGYCGAAPEGCCICAY